MKIDPVILSLLGVLSSFSSLLLIFDNHWGMSDDAGSGHGHIGLWATCAKNICVSNDPDIVTIGRHDVYSIFYDICVRLCCILYHDDVIKWKHFPRYWPFVREIHRWPVNSPHKGQWRRALMFLLSCFRIYGWANNREAGDLRRLLAHYDVTVMMFQLIWDSCPLFALIWLQQWNNPPGLLFTKRHRHLRV